MSNLPLQRVLVIAPHPDDDVIACGGLLQRAEEARILFVTDGDRNPWPQRLLLRKFLLDDADRAAWGDMRRREAVASLATLGIDAWRGNFLAFRDQGLMSMARRNDPAPREQIEAAIREFAPTLIISPSSFDAHYDHRAIAWYAHRAAAACGAEIVTYVIHGHGPQSRIHSALELTASEVKRKSEAICCHQSQLFLSRGRFLSYASATEEFYRAEHDVVRIETPLETLLLRIKHALLVLFARGHASRVEAAADVEHRPSDVPRLL